MSKVKIAIYGSHGLFSLTAAGNQRFLELTGQPFDPWSTCRSNRHLIQVVEEGLAYEDVEIEELPEGTEYHIDEYDGLESIVRKDEMSWDIARVEG